MTGRPDGRSAAIDPVAVTELRAGDLTGSFVNGDLIDLRWRGSEILQRIYMAVRDKSWNTIPARFGTTTLVSAGDEFRVEFEAVNEDGDMAFEWRGVILGSADGALSYSWQGRAMSSFEYCKIGLNLHHALDAHLGREFAIRTTTGEAKGTFGRDIVPQLVKDGSLTAMTPYFDELRIHVDGSEATFSFEGDLFELQDHRNWADANWKTYGTPLQFGFPMSIGRDEELGQAVRIVASGAGSRQRSGKSTCELLAPAGANLPKVGHLLSSEPTSAELDQLASLHPDHIRVDLRTSNLSDVLSVAARVCAALSCHLEVGAFVRSDDVDGDARKLAAALATVEVPIDRVLVLEETTGFSEFGGAASPSIADTLAAALADKAVNVGSIVSGTPQSFNDLNRSRPDYSTIDGVVFALNPQVHAADDLSLMQNTGAITHIVDFARRLFGNVDVVLSPVDLIGVNGPFPAGPAAAGASPANEDPRLWSSFAAAWTVAALAEMSNCSTTSATFFELVGARGLVRDADVSPVARLFAALSEVRDWELVETRISTPDRIAVLAFSRGDQLRTVVANLTPLGRAVHLSGIGGQRTLELQAYEVVIQ